jgi:hypothetical protein
MTNLVEKPLTELQKKFARLYVESSYGTGHLTNTEAAIQAGYSPDSAYQRAYELLNPKICPHVVKYIGELKEDFRIKNNIDPDKHMARLNHLGRLAEEHRNYGVAGRMEELRGKVAGYYIDRQIIKQKGSIEDLTEAELEERMKTILDDNKLLLEKKKSKKNGKL